VGTPKVQFLFFHKGDNWLVFFAFKKKNSGFFDTHKIDTFVVFSFGAALYRRRRASLLRSFSLRKAELGFFHFLRNSDRLNGTFFFRWSEDPSTASLFTFHHRRRSHLLKTDFFRHVRQGSWKYKRKMGI